MGSQHQQLRPLQTISTNVDWFTSLPGYGTPTTAPPTNHFYCCAIMDLMAQQQITTNVVNLDAELIDAFDLYWVKIMGKDKGRNPVQPFYHLKSDGFWHLVPITGKDDILKASSKITSIKQLNNIVKEATIDKDLYALLQDPQSRDTLRRVLIETYFAPDTRPLLVEVGEITAQSFAYSRELLNRSRGKFTLEQVPDVEDHYYTESRSVGFRRTIVNTYQHTCAVCKIRIVTPENYTAVSAAHIVPWSVSHNDDPRNGMALCGLHHWAFDKGLIGVTNEYHIVISPVIPDDDEPSRPLRELHEQGIFLPHDDTLYPAKQALRWHYKNVYRD